MTIMDMPMTREASWTIATRAQRSGPTISAEFGYGTAPKYAVSVEAGLYKYQGNERPHFAATGEVLNMRRRGDNRVEQCGCLHDMIVKYFPAFACVVRVHLADDRGVPMHAVANANHWAGFSRWGGKNDRPMSPRGPYDKAELFETDADGLEWSPTRLANHLRVSVEKAREIREYVAGDPNHTEAMTYMCKTLEAQWQAEADKAYAFIMARRLEAVDRANDL